VLILDEPTSGLDPAQTVEIRALIRSLAGERTIVFSTHVLSEVEATCDAAVVISRGRVLAKGPLDAVCAGAVTGERCRIRVALAPKSDEATALTRKLGEIEAVQEVRANVEATADLELLIQANEDVRSAVARCVHEAGAPLTTLERVHPSLEEAFLGLVGQDAGVQRGVEHSE
jgi:ABC-2 type transport system ATP-binding protein